MSTHIASHELYYAEPDTTELQSETAMQAFLREYVEFVPVVDTPLQETTSIEAQDEDVKRYPDMTFSFEPAKMIGTSLIAATTPSRLRTILRSLHTEWPDYPIADYPQLEMTHKATVLYCRGVIKFHGTTYRRDDILPLQRAVSECLDMLRTENHPTWQVLMQADKQFPDIGAANLRQVRDYLVSGAHADEIRQRYNQEILAFKQNHSDI